MAKFTHMNVKKQLSIEWRLLQGMFLTM